ncbi:TPA: hypothetical protein ACGOR9_002214 [Streptococcus suis]
MILRSNKMRKEILGIILENISYKDDSSIDSINELISFLMVIICELKNYKVKDIIKSDSSVSMKIDSFFLLNKKNLQWSESRKLLSVLYNEILFGNIRLKRFVKDIREVVNLNDSEDSLNDLLVKLGKDELPYKEQLTLIKKIIYYDEGEIIKQLENNGEINISKLSIILEVFIKKYEEKKLSILDILVNITVYSLLIIILILIVIKSWSEQFSDDHLGKVVAIQSIPLLLPFIFYVWQLTIHLNQENESQQFIINVKYLKFLVDERSK